MSDPVVEILREMTAKLGARFEDTNGVALSSAKVDMIEGLSDDIREKMARALGDDRVLHHLCLTILVGDVLGMAALNPHDMDRGIEALAKGAKTRGTMTALTRLVEELEQEDAD